MSISALTQIEKIETDRRAAAEASKQELRAVAYVRVKSGKPWVSIESTEAATLHVVQKLLADDAYANIEILTWEQGDKRLEEIILADRRERDAKERAEFARRNTPVVGQGATELLYTDHRAYLVLGISPSGKQVKVLHLDPQTLGCKSQRLNADDGSLPVSGYRFTQEELNGFLAEVDFENSRFEARDVETAYLRKDGRFYVHGGRPLVFGHATQSTDYRF
jgi:hypothetical protein